MSGYLPAALMNQPKRLPQATAPVGQPPVDPWSAVGVAVNVAPASDPWDAVSVRVPELTWDDVSTPVADVPLLGDAAKAAQSKVDWSQYTPIDQYKDPRLVPVTDPAMIKALNAMPNDSGSGYPAQSSGNWWERAPLAPDSGTATKDDDWWKNAPLAPEGNSGNGTRLVPVEGNPFDQFDTPMSSKPPSDGANPFDQFDGASSSAPEMVRVPVVAGRAGVVGYRMVPKAQLDAGTSGALADAGRVAANGATLGGFDNAVAGVQALAGSGNYQDNLAAQHALTQEAMQRPGSSFLYNSAAMAPGMVGAGGAAAGAEALGGGLVAKLGMNAGAGALLSGADAFNNADGSIRERLLAAKNPALVGAGLGAAVPPAAELLGNLASAGARKVANAYYDARYGNILPKGAADPILAGIEMQGGNVPQVAQRLQSLGPGATLADTGEGLLGQTNRLANNDIAVRPGIAQNLTRRLDTLDNRLGQAVDQNFGQDVNAPQMVTALKNQTAANAKTAYDPIFANTKPVDVSPVLQSIDNTLKPGGPGMTGSGVSDPYIDTLRRLRGYIAGQGSQAFDMQTLHNAQQLINDAGRAANQAGNGFQAGQIWDLRKQLMNQMDAANPGYLNATKQYATDKSIQEAFDEGRNILSLRQDGTVYDPDLLQQNMANMSAPEQQAFQTGARKSLTDVMGQARSDPAGLRTRLANDNGYAVGKLRQVFGEGPVNNMLAELEAQGTMRGTNNAVLGNSATAFRSAADDTIPGFSKEARAPGGESASLPMSIMAGAEVGHQLGSLVGSPELGAGVGAVAGPAVKWLGGKVAASRLAGSEGAQAAARAAMAESLSNPNKQALVDALMARSAVKPGAQNASEAAQAVTRAILMQQAAEGRNSALYAPAQRFLPAPLVGQ